MTHGTQIGLRGPSFDPWGPKMSSFGPKIESVRPSFALSQPVSFSSAINRANPPECMLTCPFDTNFTLKGPHLRPPMALKGFYNMPPPVKMTPDRLPPDIVPPDILPPRNYATPT